MKQESIEHIFKHIFDYFLNIVSLFKILIEKYESRAKYEEYFEIETIDYRLSDDPLRLIIFLKGWNEIDIEIEMIENHKCLEVILLKEYIFLFYFSIESTEASHNRK
jgi:hypothetical protein